MNIPVEQITGLLLAGGEGRRMGGLDKGLQLLRGMPLAAHVMRRLTPQVGTLLISANRHLDQYEQLGCRVIADEMSGFHGPLAGIHAGLLHCDTPWMLTAPCDSPFLPHDLAQRLAEAIVESGADLAYVVTGSSDEQGDRTRRDHTERDHTNRDHTQRDHTQRDHTQRDHAPREHPVFSLMRSDVRDSLARYLEGEGRKVREWQASINAVAVPFPDELAFRNLNTASDLADAEADS